MELPECKANGQARRAGNAGEARRIIRFMVLAFPDRGDPLREVVNHLENKAHDNIALSTVMIVFHYRISITEPYVTFHKSKLVLSRTGLSIAMLC